jgi:glycosyltransferase involved in cell wall biosynthesis
MRLLYLIAMYGPEYLGNLIHSELGHEFIKRGHEFHVFALTSAGESQGRAAETSEDGIRVYRAVAAGRASLDAVNAIAKPLFHYDRFGAGVLALRAFFASRGPFDLIMAEGAYPFGAMAALVTPTPLVITVAGGDFINSPGAAYGYGRFRSARALMRRALSRAAAIRVTTPLVRERIVALGAPPERIALVPRNIASYCYPPPGTPLQEFRATARRAVLTRLGHADAPLIAAVGRLLPIKGFDTLVRAMPAITAQVNDAHLLVVGPNRIDPRAGDYQAYLTQLASEVGVRDRVTFTGAIPHPEVREYLAAADVIAVPSVLEGMNKVAVEGAAVGTPSVVTRTAGIAELLNAADCGLVVPEDSPPALAQGIVALLTDRERHARLASRGLEFASAFTPERVGKQLIDLCITTLDY